MMELLYQSSASFENDLSLLGEPERTALINRMNELFPGYLCDPDSFCSLLENPGGPNLKNGFCSSLSILPLPGRRAVIFAIDDDPIFGQIIITLFRLVEASESAQVFRKVRQTLHCTFLDDASGAPVGD